MICENNDLEIGAESVTGYVRHENQDRMTGIHVELGQLYIVADGMGGHNAGALAAELTIEGLQKELSLTPSDARIEDAIRRAFEKTNSAVYQKAHAETEGMGSTAVLLLICDKTARVAHVGDSRAYHYSDGRLKPLTTDHTVAQKMVRAGLLKPEDAAEHPNANILERAVGSKPDIQVGIGKEINLKDGDAILLCSDGLSGYATDEEIEAILRSKATVQEIPKRLLKLALDEKGSQDNVTVQFIQYGKRKKPYRWLQAAWRNIRSKYHKLSALTTIASIH